MRNKPLHFEHHRSYREYLRHPVFRAARATAMDRTKGRCERCSGPATEVHHWMPAPDTYCRWGLFDPPSALMPVCHQCHCEIEEKSE